MTSVVLDPAAETATQTTIGEQEGEFPIVALDDVGHRYRQLLSVERSVDRASDVPDFDQVALFDVDNGRSERFSYGDDCLVEEHLLVAADGNTRPRWIVGTALDMRADSTVLSVFDASHLVDGPIAQARLPFSLPLGLHGTFRSKALAT